MAAPAIWGRTAARWHSRRLLPPRLVRKDPPVSLHPLAVVSPHAEIGTNVRIGPFCVVEAGVVLGDGCHLVGRVTVKSGTVLGRDNIVMEGTVLGGMPQHIHMPEYPGVVAIGDGNVLRENVTVHRALEAGHVTRIGNRCLLMVGAMSRTTARSETALFSRITRCSVATSPSTTRRTFPAAWPCTSSAASAAWRWSAAWHACDKTFRRL